MVGRNTERERSRRHRRSRNKHHGGTAFRFKRSDDDETDEGNALEDDVQRVFTTAIRMDTDQE